MIPQPRRTEIAAITMTSNREGVPPHRGVHRPIPWRSPVKPLPSAASVCRGLGGLTGGMPIAQRLTAEGRFRRFGNLREGRLVANGEVREHFAVDLYFRLTEPVD
jgi:hypothetical protein